MHLSHLPIRRLVFILREEYFQTPPGGPSLVRMITTSLLQELRVHQEAMSIVIVLAPHDPAVIVPTLHNLAGVAMITIRLSLSPRKKRPGNLGQLRVDEG